MSGSGSAAEPLLSVVVPARNCAGHLERCLSALAASDLPRHEWELVVVDDASIDGTAAVAARHGADSVLHLGPGPRGPASARNRGAAVARGELVTFVDADVCVQPATLRRLAEALRNDAGLSAVFGSYDTAPAHPSLLSQYRNLLHHHVHQRGAAEAATFWAGCGAVRRSAFVAAGGFDEWRYARPQIEDIELGYRLRESGGRILLRADIQAQHLKHWTLGAMLATDFRDRAVPWMRLLLERGQALRAGPLNLGARERACTALAGVAVLLLAAAALWRRPLWLVLAAVAIAGIAAGDAPLHIWLRRERGWRMVALAVPLRLAQHSLSAAAVGWALLIHALPRRRRERGRLRPAGRPA